MSREEMLELRCDAYRTMIRSICDYNDDKLKELIGKYLVNGVLAANDARYLMGVCDIEDTIKTENKPPLGVIPRDMWDRKRQEELTAAMRRFLEAGKKIPKEWLGEYNEISDRQEKQNKTLCDECALQYKDCGCDCTREFVKKEETNE